MVLARCRRSSSCPAPYTGVSPLMSEQDSAFLSHKIAHGVCEWKNYARGLSAKCLGMRTRGVVAVANGLTLAPAKTGAAYLSTRH